MKRLSDQTVFVYMYRDAANYKAGGQLLLDGAYRPKYNDDIRKRCEGGDLFVAEQLGIPTLYAELYKYSNGPTIDDVAFHEFQFLRPAERGDRKESTYWGGLDALVARFRAVRH